MKRVCHISTVHTPFSIRIFHKQLKSLNAAGYDVSFIVPNANNEKKDGIRIIALPKAKNRIHRTLWLTFKAFYLGLSQKADVYHFHDLELIPIGVILKFLKNKVIYDAHEDMPRQMLSKKYAAKFLPEKISWVIEKVENFAAKRFDAVVAATPFIRDRFLRLGCNSVDINNFPILSEVDQPDTGWFNKERAVCYVGGIGDIRGIFEMVEAIGKTNAKLLLAGQFSSSSERDRVIGMFGWANVAELGQLTWMEVQQVLSRSIAGLVVLHPCRNYIDALPIKMFEYMAAGIPVIASNFPLWREIIEGDKCGICVDPLDSGAIAEAIQWIADHPGEAKRMGKNGQKAAKEKYNWKTEEKKLLTLYEGLYP